MEYSLTKLDPDPSLCTCGHSLTEHESAEYRGNKSLSCLRSQRFTGYSNFFRTCLCTSFTPAREVKQFATLDAMFDFIRQHGEMVGWTIQVHHL